MKKLSDILGRINDATNFIGDPYKCECGEMVQDVEVELIGGPSKGKRVRNKKGCKCEDKRLADEAVAIAKRLELEKIKTVFDTNSLINADLKKATFKNYDRTRTSTAEYGLQKAVEYVKEFNRDDPKNIIFYGPPQVGKSHLSFSITRSLMARGYSAVFISVPKLLTKIKSTYNRDSSVKEEDILNHLKEVDLLVIDDLGAEKSATNSDKSWSDSLLWQIIDDRQGKHTIYTSNLNDLGLQEFYEERTYKRIMNRTEKILMKG